VVNFTRAEFIRILVQTPRNDQIRCQGLNLEGIDLSSLDLRLINFKMTNLRNANLRDCNCEYVNFECADLTGANLGMGGRSIRLPVLFRSTHIVIIRGSQLGRGDIVQGDLGEGRHEAVQL